MLNLAEHPTVDPVRIAALVILTTICSTLLNGEACIAASRPAAPTCASRCPSAASPPVAGSVARVRAACMPI